MQTYIRFHLLTGKYLTFHIENVKHGTAILGGAVHQTVNCNKGKLVIRIEAISYFEEFESEGIPTD